MVIGHAAADAGGVVSLLFHLKAARSHGGGEISFIGTSWYYCTGVLEDWGIAECKVQIADCKMVRVSKNSARAACAWTAEGEWWIVADHRKTLHTCLEY